MAIELLITRFCDLLGRASSHLDRKAAFRGVLVVAHLSGGVLVFARLSGMVLVSFNFPAGLQS